MPTIQLTDDLRAEYQSRWDTCAVRPEHASSVSLILGRITQARPRYEAVVQGLGTIPWAFVACIHQMEAGGRFTGHLHNGNPLTARTVQVPAGRPTDVDPPFTWEQSAQDALKMKNLHKWTDWSVPGILYRMEGYNGFGYRLHHPEVATPYLWSYSNLYSGGKYVADGKWDPSAISKQAGAAVILKRMVERGTVILT